MLPGYSVSLFARQTSTFTAPDAVVVDNGFVYIDYQNVTAKDCTDNNSSTIVQYEKNPGTPQQTVSRIPVGDQLDDTVWATSSQGRLLVVDSAGATYWISAPHFVPGAVYTEGPSDSGVAGFVGVVDLSTGIVTPVIIGFSSPTGMLFLPNS